ncbi:unnamed protein product, partial [marine sediment metagenome]
MVRRGGQSAANRAFSYSANPHARKHGPAGYANPEQFREWLRDEFAFRCVVCLDREQWIGRIGKFHIDHIRPQATHPQSRLDYDNLVYVCVR